MVKHEQCNCVVYWFHILDLISFQDSNIVTQCIFSFVIRSVGGLKAGHNYYFGRNGPCGTDPSLLLSLFSVNILEPFVSSCQIWEGEVGLCERN